MAVGETLFERVVGERTICEREEAHYASLVGFYALADARFRDEWRITDATYFPDEGHVMVSWERYLGRQVEGAQGRPEAGPAGAPSRARQH